MTFAKQMDLDEAPRHVRSRLISNLLDTLIVYIEKEIGMKQWILQFFK